jgi:GDP-L-fucose synthase
MDASERIFVAGGTTLLGSAILRQLENRGSGKLVGTGSDSPDLTDSESVRAFFANTHPDYVFLAAGKSGGIEANKRYPADLILDNILVNTHTISAAHDHGVKKLVYLASSCTYPRDCPQPMRVESLMTGPFEPTNDAYATAKLAGIKLCQAYRQQHGDNFVAAIPANMFGIGDDFSLENSHVVGALIRKMHEAKEGGDEVVECWGTGSPRREFLFADDIADAAITVMEKYDDAAPINLGGGTDVSIRELAEAIKKVVGYDGALTFDASKPDGMPLKALESSALKALGWQAPTSFDEALCKTYEWYLTEEVRS